MKFWEMSEEERVKAITEHVRRHWHDRGCPMCLQTDWTMTEGYTRLDMSEFGQRFAQIGGRAVPGIPLVCNHCGFIAVLSTKVIGIEHN